MADEVTSVRERGTQTYVIQFEDEAEPPNGVVPNSASWSLRDSYGNIVNEREDVPIPLDAVAIITCSNDDFAFATDDVWRFLTILYTYDSNYGEYLTNNIEIQIEIEPRIGVLP